jgi:glycerol-3-phosphate dehydrogenase
VYRKYGLDRKKIEKYDIVIIGGGIVGAGLFREQALHGTRSLLLDQADFNSQTSHASSKMLHGGIRYLENLDFALVFEALKEKNLWLKLAPHITKEIPFYLPVYKESKWPLFFMRIGLMLYDALSLFKNSPHHVLNKQDTMKHMPGLRAEGLTGCGMYYDGIVDDSKLGLECIYDGLENKTCEAKNYKRVSKVEKTDELYTVTYEDVLTNEITKVSTKHVIFATGPFTDQVMKKLNIEWIPVILPSKGTHLWLKEDALPIKNAMVLQTKDKRIIFVIPQRHTILVGTTEDPIAAETPMLDLKPTEKEIEYLLDVVNEYFPHCDVNNEHVLSSFSGIRPLVKTSGSSSKTSRMHKIYTPKPNMHVLVGGKYTTFRMMAQHLNKTIFKDLDIKHDKTLTLKPFKKTSVVKNPFDKKITREELRLIMKTEKVRTIDDLVERRLSLPSLEHYDSTELKKLLNEINDDLNKKAPQ